jgi:hypothetical protein
MTLWRITGETEDGASLTVYAFTRGWSDWPDANLALAYARIWSNEPDLYNVRDVAIASARGEHVRWRHSPDIAPALDLPFAWVEDDPGGTLELIFKGLVEATTPRPPARRKADAGGAAR